MHRVKVKDLIKILVDDAYCADVSRGMVLRVHALLPEENQDGGFEVIDADGETWSFDNSCFDNGLIKLYIASKPLKKFNSKVVKICNKTRDNLQLHLDYDTDPKKAYPQLFFTPNMDNTDIHYHIPLSIAEARKMRDWLTKFLKGKK